MKKINRYPSHPFAEGWASVSEVCGQLEKPYLYGWFAKLGQEAHRINADSKEIGKLIDNEICHYFGDIDTPEINRKVLENKESNGYYLQAIKNFHTLVEEIKPVSILGQHIVYSKPYRYIGTFDRLMAVDNKLVLSDWKATNFIDYSYRMQLEAYYRALINMISNGIIVLEDKFASLEWHEYPLWICQFPKKEKVNLEKNIIKFKPNEIRWNNFQHLLNFYYGKKEDEVQIKAEKKEKLK